MRRRNGLCLFLFLALGCGGGDPAARDDRARAARTDPSPLTLMPPPPPPVETKGIYQGRTAVQWAEQFQHREPAVRSKATRALADLGKDGFPHLLQGMRSERDEVRVECLRALTQEQVLAQGKEMYPQLLEMLRDPSAEVRKAAVARVAWFGAQAKAVQGTLETLALNDPDTEVRSIAIDTLNSIAPGAAKRLLEKK